MKLLLDTCVVSEIRRTDGSETVKQFIDAMAADTLFLSIITLGEITKGIALVPDGQKNYDLTAWRIGLCEQFADRILPLDQESAEIWGQLTAAGQLKGTMIPVADGLIAATALRHGCQVATRNMTHFEAAGAVVINPWYSTLV